jgi:hypothetical protein
VNFQIEIEKDHSTSCEERKDSFCVKNVFHTSFQKNGEWSLSLKFVLRLQSDCNRKTILFGSFCVNAISVKCGGYRDFPINFIQMASPAAEEENIIEFNIGELGVANTGGSIDLVCNGVKCRLDVPPQIPVGTVVRINFTACENKLENSQIGLSNLNEFRQPDTLMNTGYQPEPNRYQQPAPKKKWDGTLSAVKWKFLLYRFKFVSNLFHMLNYSFASFCYATYNHSLLVSYQYD